VSNAKRNSVEWIIEDSGGTLPDFGTVDFSACYAIVGIPDAVGSFPASSVFEITMDTSDGKGTVMSQPSSLPTGATSFTDAWMNPGP
jgi:hypothetical protein